MKPLPKDEPVEPAPDLVADLIEICEKIENRGNQIMGSDTKVLRQQGAEEVAKNLRAILSRAGVV